jgi:hypothetical protein
MPFFAALSFRKHARLRCNRSQAALKSDPLLLLPPPGSNGLLLPTLLLVPLPPLPADARGPPEGLLPYMAAASKPVAREKTAAAAVAAEAAAAAAAAVPAPRLPLSAWVNPQKLAAGRYLRVE